jgi:hypothetical protein
MVGMVVAEAMLEVVQMMSVLGLQYLCERWAQRDDVLVG